VVVNMARSDAAARDLFRRLCLVCSRFLSAKLRYVGHVPRDENIHRAVMNQRPLVEAFPQAPASRAMTVIADRVLRDAPVPSAGGLKFFWQGLMRSGSSSAPSPSPVPADLASR
jgi:flagellar biosynthesis protein FlhG